MSEEQLQQLESLANMMRGMSMDMRIPSEARRCLIASASELDSLIADVIDHQQFGDDE